ncbi:ABC transporter ATP-binding protein [Clostridium magnum]|uniref:Putative ABC transporter ATP-binding protein YxlF n=1 Tax=Clostridium magnum DSM 2767 TaxID=1121326 RepID=A0A162SQ03_9CLOT|nr:ATP-binding cassette domain-containing protein [Clostridium magnum]KZL91719.1 putative ABC transporter ATP-binding protein YxlF [Clostridium magnum DSM 2767]SHJ04437.1 ABC-2 type transport system ATP-binding protein [Clostridium magnum DSM 2767]
MALIIDNLTKTYKNGRGIKSVSFQVNEGDIYGLLGPNGSGKTTTMKIITGLSRADEGDVQIFGRSVENDGEKSLEHIGCLIEAPAVYEYMSAKKNLENAAAYYKDIKAPRIEDILRQTGLLQYQNDKVKEFSLGMKQRLGLALALLSNPKLVILDEPANGLDIEGMVAIREIIMTQAKSKGITFLISSHLAHELEVMCNKIAIMKEGRLLKTATIKEVLEKSGSLEKYFLETVESRKQFGNMSRTK